MSKALAVAHYLICRAGAEDEPQYLTHMQLQKLLYYVQGWSLALRDQEIFPEIIQAWAHGPVVRDLYPRFATYGSYPITCESITTDDEDLTSSECLAEDEIGLIEGVWNVYRPYSASLLRDMTHKETPWLDARRGLAPADKGNTEITKDAMKAFFIKQAEADDK